MENLETITVTKGVSETAPEDVGYRPETMNVLEGHIKGLMNQGKLQCASYLISRNEQVLAVGSMGKLRCDEGQEPFLPDSIRRIASITKVVVAVAVMQLVEQGKVRLDQPVSEILEEFKPAPLDKVTVFHLLTHTSGIRPDPGAHMEPYPRYSAWRDDKDWIRTALEDPLYTEPGKLWRYSSTGFAMLGEIVTRVSGIHFEKYALEHIARPLGMNDTYFDVPQEKAYRVCLSNPWELKRFKNPEPHPEWAAPRGGGGLFSTLWDLRKLGQMLVNKGTYNGVRILGRKTVESMTRNQLKNVRSFCWGYNGAEVEYGLGIQTYSNNTFLSPGSFSHEGAGLSGLFMDPVENMVLVYICPMCDGIGWVPEAVTNLRNIVWSGIE